MFLYTKIKNLTFFQIYYIIVVIYCHIGEFMENKYKVISTAFLCPHCHSGMYVANNGKSAYCLGERAHCFDFSSDGYLAMGQGGGDSKEAVKARKAFLSKDYYLAGADEICRVAEKYIAPDALLVDAGCGEGYYTNKIAAMAKNTIGFDLSKFACSAAARSAKASGVQNVLYATGSVFELPINDGAADMVVNIFAPCAEDEYTRILRSGGYLVVVGAGEGHLMGLKEALYENTYLNAERADMPKSLRLVERASVEFDIEVVGNEDIQSLFLMTPYYWRTKASDKEKLTALSALKTKIEFEISVFRK